MPERLTGFDAKIERAKKHIGEIKVAVRTFIDSAPYEVFTYSEIESKVWVWAIDVGKDPPPDLASILGDVLNNLRSALDYLAWELAAGRGNDQLSFPISQTEQGFKAAVKGIENLGVGNAAVKLLLATQAYKGGNGHGLWQLHQLNRREKHRFLMPVGAAIREIVIDVAAQIKAFGWVSAQYPSSLSALPTEPKFPLKDGTIVYRIAPSAWSRGVGLNPKFTFYLAFGEGESFDGEPILPTLTHLSQLVEETIKPFRPLLS